MKEIDKVNEKSLPQKIRSEHEPQIGDVYKSNSMTYEGFVRITDIEVCKGIDGKEFKRLHITEYDMYKRKWNEKSREISPETLLQYYSYVIFDFDEMLRQFDELESGKVSFDGVEPVESTALVAKGKNDLLQMKEQQEMTIERVNYMREMMVAKANDYKRAIELKMKPLEQAIASMRKTVSNMQYAISVIEGYLGVGVDAIKITEGESAEQCTPVSIRQRILFMDEEVACILEDNQGLDYHDKNMFYEWMKDKKHRDIIVPEQRCIVVMKPKRFDHNYSCDWVENQRLNEWNHHSFLVIRDGENVMCIESDNLCIYDKVFFKVLVEYKEKDSWYDKERKEQEAERKAKRIMYLLAVLQGMKEQGILFGGDPSINFVKDENVSKVYDDEDETMIGTGIMPFYDFVDEKNKSVRRGSRILYYSGGEPKRYYYNDYSRPPQPDFGVYNIDVDEKGVKSFLYMPKDEIWSYEEGYHERKRRESWQVESRGYINYDAVTSEEIEMYMQDRTQRKFYVHIIPLLTNLWKSKKDEESWERDFSNLMAAQFKEYDETLVKQIISDAIVWWREKVIYIRPLKSDDKKSWRMIKGYVERRLCAPNA